MWLIVGLGNPGSQYELTRHNIGFLVADYLLGSHTCKKNFSSESAKIEMGDQPCLILKPLTFMNKSGLAVQQAMAFHKIEPSQIIVIHDELDLALGEMRIKQSGGDGGHNGLKDITRLIGSNYVRIRLGIDRPKFKGSEADYVLAPFTKPELVKLEELFPKVFFALESLIKRGLEKTQAEHQIKAEKKA